MKKLTQNRLHISESPKERGNCYPTVIACVMGLDSPEDCIQIQEHYDNTNWYGKLVKWLRVRGWILSQIKGHLNNGEFYFVIGESQRGNSHICIYRNSELYHDPHPDRTGLVNESSFQISTQQSNP